MNEQKLSHLELVAAGNGGWLVLRPYSGKTGHLLDPPVAAYSSTNDMLSGLRSLLLSDKEISEEATAILKGIMNSGRLKPEAGL